MNLITTAFSKIFKSGNQQELNKIKPIVNQINEREPSLKSLSDHDLKEKTLSLKKRVKNGESLEDLVPDSFSLVREAARRVLNERHYDVQLVGGIILHQGKIA